MLSLPGLSPGCIVKPGRRLGYPLLGVDPRSRRTALELLWAERYGSVTSALYPTRCLYAIRVTNQLVRITNTCSWALTETICVICLRKAGGNAALPLDLFLTFADEQTFFFDEETKKMATKSTP